MQLSKRIHSWGMLLEPAAEDVLGVWRKIHTLLARTGGNRSPVPDSECFQQKPASRDSFDFTLMLCFSIFML
jgi:hypothetical protein